MIVFEHTMTKRDIAARLANIVSKCNAHTIAGGSLAIIHPSVEAMLLCEMPLFLAGLNDNAINRFTVEVERADGRPRRSDIDEHADIVFVTFYRDDVCELYVQSDVMPAVGFRWTVPVEEQANAWANAYLAALEDVDPQCVCEGMTAFEWDKHADFVVECWKAGVKPTHFLDTLHDFQKRFNEMLGASDLEIE